MKTLRLALNRKPVQIQQGGRVLTREVGRDMSGGFWELPIKIPSPVRNVSTIIRHFL
jgi:hypothetical protein